MESNVSVENKVVTTAGHHDRGEEDLQSDGKPDESDDDSDIEDDLLKSIKTLKEMEFINNMISVTGDEKQYRPYLLHNYFINYMKHHTLKNYPLWYSDRRRLSECREEDEDEDKKDVSPKPSENVTVFRPILEKKNCTATSDSASTASDSESVKQASKEQIFDEEEDKMASKCNMEEIVIDKNINDNDNDKNQDSLPTKKKFIVVKTPIAQAFDFNKNYKMSNTIQIPVTETYNRPTARSLFNRLSPMPSPHLDRRFFDSSLVEMRSLASSTSTLADSLEDIWIRRYDFSDSKDSRGGFSSGEFDTKSLNSQTTTPGKSTKSSYKGSYGSRSASNSRSSSVERRKSGDEQQFSPKKATFEGISRPRSKSDVTKKKGNSFMSQMRHAMQNTGLMSMRMFKDGSAHPVKDCNNSDTQYYHTVTAAVSTNQSRSAMTKVMDIFRNRSHTSTSPDDRKKSKNLNHQYSLQGAHLRKSNFDLEKRRQSLGSVHHRSSDLFVDPQHAAILFRDARGLPVVDPFLEKVNKSELQNEYQIFVKFFKFHTCYDLIPNSAKLVVFDTQLSVKKAFYALVYNDQLNELLGFLEYNSEKLYVGVRAAPLWDCDLQEFVGMLTITDFIRILQMHYASNLKMDELENHKLDTWKKQLHLNQPLISINPENSLFDAIKILIDNKIHRLPIIDPKTGDVLHILTHKRILKFLYLYINELPKPSYVSKTLKNCQVGTYENIEVAYENTTIIAALDKFVERRISALPIVDKEGKLIDIYAKFDVINLAADKTYNDLDVTLRKANEHRNEWFEGVYRCKLDETLFTVIEKFVKFQVHRLVVVDDDEKVIGIISLSDLFQYLILNPIADELESGMSSLPKTQDIFFVQKVLTTNEEPLKITEPTTDTDQSDNSDEINEEFSDNSANSNSNSNSNTNACLTEVVVSNDQ